MSCLYPSLISTHIQWLTIQFICTLVRSCGSAIPRPCSLEHLLGQLSGLLVFSSSSWNSTQVESPCSVFLTRPLITNCSAVLFDIQITLFPLYFHSRYSLEWYYLTFNEHNRVLHHLLWEWIRKLFARIPEQIFPGAQVYLIYWMNDSAGHCTDDDSHLSVSRLVGRNIVLHDHFYMTCNIQSFILQSLQRFWTLHGVCPGIVQRRNCG